MIPLEKQFTAKWIKTSLLSYYRYIRQWICATEVISSGESIADVLVDTGRKIIEVEVKIDHSDLLNDTLKQKHRQNKDHYPWRYVPNQFYYCIPEKLLKDTEEVVNRTNPKYGIIVYCPRYPNQRFEDRLIIHKKAKNLKEEYSSIHRGALLKRLCSELVTLHQKELKG